MNHKINWIVKIIRKLHVFYLHLDDSRDDKFKIHKLRFCSQLPHTTETESTMAITKSLLINVVFDIQLLTKKRGV